MSRYLVSLHEAKTCLCIHVSPKIMVQFCYLSLRLGIETVSCSQLQRMVRMDKD